MDLDKMMCYFCGIHWNLYRQIMDGSGQDDVLFLWDTLEVIHRDNGWIWTR